jgi:phage terminase large subunit-like protein
MTSTRTLGDDIADFITRFVVPPRKLVKIDEHGNEIEEYTEDEQDEFRVRPWQRWWLRHAFELDEKTGLLKHNKILLHIPRKNGKSFLTSGILLYWLFYAKEGDELYCAAKSSKQARIVFDLCRNLVYGNPLLQRVIKPSQHKLENRFVTAWLEPVSSDGGGFHGKAPFGTAMDELHALSTRTGTSTRADDMYAAASTGSKDRNEWFLLGITTSGEDDTGLAYSLWEYGVQLSMNCDNKDGAFSFASWMAEDEDDIYDPKTWLKSNPSLFEGLLSMEEFEKDIAAIDGNPKGSTNFEIFALNKWIRGGGSAADFISGHQWKLALKPELGKLKPGEEITVGFDGSLGGKHADSTGIIGISVETGLMEVLYCWEKDPLDPEWQVPVDDVEDAMDKVMADYNVALVYCDPSWYRGTVQRWRKAYGSSKVIEIPPMPTRMAPMSQDWKSDVLNGQLWHVGEKKLSTHVRNAVENIKGTPQKERPKSPNKIDFLMCAILANGARHQVLDKKSKKKRGRIGVM